MRDVAQFLKALGDDARLQILWLLFRHRELCVCDLMGVLGFTQSKASRHLATLRHARLVVDRREGAWSYYSLREANSELERAVLESLRRELARFPDVQGLDKALAQWLARSQRSGACSPPTASASPSKNNGREKEEQTVDARLGQGSRRNHDAMATDELCRTPGQPPLAHRASRE